MNHHLNQLSLEELKKLVKMERKRFIEGLEKDLNTEELHLIRLRIRELSALLDKKTNSKGKHS